MPSTPLTCCSIGPATESSRVCALAPGKLALTTTSGGEMAGNSPTGSNGMEISPLRTITTDTTMASLGRLMNVAEIMVPSGPGAGRYRRQG